MAWMAIDPMPPVAQTTTRSGLFVMSILSRKVSLIPNLCSTAPEWPHSECDATYRVDVVGDPDIHCELTLGEAEGHGAGRAAMTSTAMRVVNAIPYVVEAPPGLLSSLDIPMTLPRHAFD